MYAGNYQDESSPLLASSTASAVRRLRTRNTHAAPAPRRFSPAFALAPARVDANAAPTASEKQHPLINTGWYVPYCCVFPGHPLDFASHSRRRAVLFFGAVLAAAGSRAL